MSRLGQRVTVAIAAGTILLFAGKAIAEFLTDYWWAEGISFEAGVFAMRWSLLGAGLDLAGVTLSTAWFAVHLLWAAKQIRQHNRSSAVTGNVGLGASQLLWWSAGMALLLGALTGAGFSDLTPVLVLFSADPRWGITDPIRGLDAGIYLAALPLWQFLQGAFLVLTLLAFVACIMLYAVGGSLRITDRNFSLAPAVRIHLGILGLLLASAIACGYLLHPFELAAGLRPAASLAQAMLLTSIAWLMAGLAAAAAVLSAVWSLKGRIFLPLGAWATLFLFGAAFKLMAPVRETSGDLSASLDDVRALEIVSFGIPELDSIATPSASLAPIWTPALIPSRTGGWLAADRIMIQHGGRSRAVLLLVEADESDEGARVVAVADDTVTALGGPLSYRSFSEPPYPGIGSLAEFTGVMSLPGKRRIFTGVGHSGIRAGGMARRLLISWNLQVNALALPPESQVAWRLDPRERLLAMVPFVSWGPARPRVINRELVWISEGYLFSNAFPGVAGVPWRGRSVSYLRAAYLGVVAAESAQVSVFELPNPDPIVRAWGAFSRRLISPPGQMPAELVGELGYPRELFAVQATVLQRPQWNLGSLVRLPPGEIVDTIGGPIGRSLFSEGGRATINYVLEGRMAGDIPKLELYQLDSTLVLDPPNLLMARWNMLPFVSQTRDSLAIAGAQLRLSVPVVHWSLNPRGLMAEQRGFVTDSSGRSSVALVNIAMGERLGTGRVRSDALANLSGQLAAIPGRNYAADQLTLARSLLLQADSAMHRGDLAAFARAFEALRAVLENPP